MPLFYLHVRDNTTHRDPEGIDLPGLAAAEAEAVASARELLAEGDRAGQDRRGWAVEIADGKGRHLLTVPFAEAFGDQESSRGTSPLDGA